MEKQRNAMVSKSLAAAALAAVGFCNSAHAALLLDTIYGDAGFPSNGNPYFQYDYIDLYNSGSSAVSLNGIYLAMSGFATEPVALLPVDAVPLPTAASVAPGGYYLIQLNNGTSSPAFVGTAQFTAPAPDLTLVYNSSQAGYSSGYPGNTNVAADSTQGNVFSSPYYKNGKIALITTYAPTAGAATSAVLDYVGYGTGLATGAYSTANTSYNNAYSTLAAYVGTAYAGYNQSAVYSSLGFLGSSYGLTRTNTTDSYPTEDNNNDWTVSSSFTLTDAAGASVTVPEPASAGLLAAGSALMIARRKDRKRS